MGVKFRIQNGRLVSDVVFDLPEGTEMELCQEDAGDDLDEEETARLLEEIRLSEEDPRPSIPVEELFAEWAASRRSCA